MCHGTLLMQISYQTLKAFELGHLEYFTTMKINAFSHCLIRVTLYATLSNKKTICNYINPKTYLPNIYVYKKGFVMACILAVE